MTNVLQCLNVKTKNMGKTWKKPIDTLSKCREIYTFFSLKLTLKFFKKILKEKQDQNKTEIHLNFK